MFELGISAIFGDDRVSGTAITTAVDIDAKLISVGAVLVDLDGSTVS